MQHYNLLHNDIHYTHNKLHGTLRFKFSITSYDADLIIRMIAVGTRPYLEVIIFRTITVQMK